MSKVLYFLSILCLLLLSFNITNVAFAKEATITVAKEPSTTVKSKTTKVKGIVSFQGFKKNQSKATVIKLAKKKKMGTSKVTNKMTYPDGVEYNLTYSKAKIYNKQGTVTFKFFNGKLLDMHYSFYKNGKKMTASALKKEHYSFLSKLKKDFNGNFKIENRMTVPKTHISRYYSSSYSGTNGQGFGLNSFIGTTGNNFYLVDFGIIF